MEAVEISTTSILSGMSEDEKLNSVLTRFDQVEDWVLIDEMDEVTLNDIEKALNGRIESGKEEGIFCDHDLISILGFMKSSTRFHVVKEIESKMKGNPAELIDESVKILNDSSIDQFTKRAARAIVETYIALYKREFISRVFSRKRVNTVKERIEVLLNEG